MTTLDVQTSVYSELFANAPVYRKNAVVKAREVLEEELLETILANGFKEITRLVPVGCWIITNPGGEEYAIPAERFHSRYQKTDVAGVYQAKGEIRAIQNDTGEAIGIVAPWGGMQYGDSDCIIAAGCDENMNPTDYRYIIGYQEFLDTYFRVD